MKTVDVALLTFGFLFAMFFVIKALERIANALEERNKQTFQK